MASSVAELFVVLDSVTDPFSAGMKKAAADAEAQSHRMSSALGMVTKVGLGLGAAVGGIAVASVKAAAGFQATMETLHTQAGVAQNQIAGLSAGVLDLAGKVGFSPTSLAEALYHIESSFASVGITGPKALNLLQIAAEGAAVGHADLVDVTNALDAAIASGIPGVENFQQAMGVLNSVVGSGDMTMQDLANAFSTGALANVKSYGASILDVGAALAVYGDNNIRGQNAATDLRMAMQALQTPAATASVLLEKMGMDAHTLGDTMSKGGLLPALELLHQKMTALGYTEKTQGAALTELFGKKAGAGIVVLYDQLDRLKSKYPDQVNGAKNFADAWVQTKSTVSQQVKEIGAGVDALGVRIGLWLIPQVSKLISLGQSDLGQIASGFNGPVSKPVNPGLGNAFLNKDMTPAPPPLTGWQEFGEKLHQYFTDIENDAKKLEPLGRDVLTFGEDAYQGLSKILPVAVSVGETLGKGLFLGAEAAGTVLRDVLGPAIKWVGDFIDAHQTLFKIFADVVLGGIVAKMTILGGINATKGLIDLATRIVQFPVGQVGEITTAWKGMTAAWTRQEAAQGEQAVQGLAGAFGDLKTKASGVLDKVLPDSGKLAGLAQMSKDFKAVSTEAHYADEQLSLFGVTEKGVTQLADHQQLELFSADMATMAKNSESAATGTAKSATSMVGIAGALGKTALPLGIIIGGAGMLGDYLGHLAGVGDHTAQSMDDLNTRLQLAGNGSAQARDQFTQLAVQLVIAQNMMGQFGKHVQGLQDVDTALANLAKNGNAQQARDEFNQIAAALAKQGIDASTAARDFPQYESAIKDAGNAAETMAGKVQDAIDTMQHQQGLGQFKSDVDSLTQSIKDNGGALAGNSAQAQQNIKAYRDVALEALQFYRDQVDGHAPMDQANQDLLNQYNQLEAVGTQFLGSKQKADDFLKSLGMIKPDYSTTISANIDPAMQALNTLLAKVDSSVGYIQVMAPDSGGRAVHNADGGPVRRGQASWVGERGRELVVFGADGYVIPHETLTGSRPLDPRILSGSGGYSASAYTSGYGGGTAVVNNYFVTNQTVQGSVLGRIELENLIVELVQQRKLRNSSTGMG